MCSVCVPRGASNVVLVCSQDTAVIVRTTPSASAVKHSHWTWMRCRGIWILPFLNGHHIYERWNVAGRAEVFYVTIAGWSVCLHSPECSGLIWTHLWSVGQWVSVHWLHVRCNSTHSTLVEPTQEGPGTHVGAIVRATTVTIWLLAWNNNRRGVWSAVCHGDRVALPTYQKHVGGGRWMKDSGVVLPALTCHCSYPPGAFRVSISPQARVSEPRGCTGETGRM